MLLRKIIEDLLCRVPWTIGRSRVNQIRRHFETNEPGNETESREERRRERVISLSTVFHATPLILLRLLSLTSLRLRPLPLPLKFPKHFALISLYSSSLFSYPVLHPHPYLYPFIHCILDRPSVPFASFSILANNNAFL